MLNGKKGQAFMEVLTVQAMSLLILAISLTLLALMFKSNYNCLIPGFGGATPSFFVTEMQFLSNTSAYGADGFYVELTPKSYEDFYIDGMTLYDNNKTCWSYTFGTELHATNDLPIIMNGISNCSKSSWVCGRYTFDVSFSKGDAQQLTRLEHGSIYTVLEEYSQPLYYTDGWRSTNYGDDDDEIEPLKSRNNNPLGSFGNACPGVPPSSSDLNATVNSTINWDIPNGCDNQVNNKGFAKLYCNTSMNSSKLASGWITTNLRVHPIFKGHNVFLVGNATWIDEDSIPRTDGICINDNMYFYLNGVVVAKGGTAGIQSSDNKLDAGEEVLKSCGGCSSSSSVGWCVPPLNLTTYTGFKYTGANLIHVLLEDTCKQGGEPNGGGMTPFGFYFF